MNKPSFKTNLLLLMHPPFAAAAQGHAHAAGTFGRVHNVQSLDELRQACADAHWDALIAFGTGVVVPRDVLDRFGSRAVNVHPASPAYPGRDPHHFAAYDGATEFGATLHVMASAVDQGDILAVDLVPVPEGAAPAELLAIGSEAGARLVRGYLHDLAQGHAPAPAGGLRWTGPVRRRSDFVALCRVDASMSAEEVRRRAHAASMPGYANLWTEVYGRRFVLAGPV